MKSKFTNDEVNAVMESRGINRKSAVKFLSRAAKVSKRGTNGHRSSRCRSTGKGRSRTDASAYSRGAGCGAQGRSPGQAEEAGLHQGLRQEGRCVDLGTAC